MDKKIKVLIVTLFSVIALVGGVIFMVSNGDTAVKKNVPVKTDKEPIFSRFPKLGDFQNCYWKADVIGKEYDERIPGPSAYWMKGFVEIDNEKLNSFIEKYNMKETDSTPQMEFFPENFDSKASKWFYSDEFNNYIKPPSFLGKFYIDSVNQVIYFDVNK